MPTIALPDNPDLEHLKNEAKDLHRAVSAGDAEAVAHAAEHRGVPATGPFKLTHAQRVVARHYGFANWAALRSHVVLVNGLRRRPDDVPVSEDRADELLRLACLTYGRDDGPHRWREAEAIVAADPAVAHANLFTAAACGDLAHVRALLAEDPSAADREGGPFAWTPLLYLTSSRIGEPSTAPEIARALLECGASPDAGYLWDGTYPFTALTMTFGEGEMGPVRQPRHPVAEALARVLLAAGADPNDTQTLYNRMFQPANDHLELLFEFGLGQAAGGPWHKRVPLESPEEMLRGQLLWAVQHGFVERVELLAAHGVDIAAPFDAGSLVAHDGRTPAEVALLSGHGELVDALVALGASPPALYSASRAGGLDTVEQTIVALLSGDAGEVARLRAAQPNVLDAVKERRPGLMTWAAGTGSVPSVELLVDAGFDIDALGRADVPLDHKWQTALHQAAGDGNVALVTRLLELGADPTVRDARFDGTALDWARHEGQADIVPILEALTPEASP